MHNILDFTEYKNQVRLYEERLVLEQIKTRPINEGMILSTIRNKINDKATIFTQMALSEEIEMMKNLEKEIKAQFGELEKHYDEKMKRLKNAPYFAKFKRENPKAKEFYNGLKTRFERIDKANFNFIKIVETNQVDLSAFLKNATMAVFVNFGVMFIPTRSIFLLKKAYKYFIGIIKQTIHKDMLYFMLNFDDFRNAVLLDSQDEYVQDSTLEKEKEKIDQAEEILQSMLTNSNMSSSDRKTLREIIDQKIKVSERRMKLNQNSRSSINFSTRYDNTYKNTLERLKTFSIEDDQKYLEGIKKGMQGLALDEVDTKSFVELIISAAEESAFEVSNAIHTEFIKLVGFFSLMEQKELMDMLRRENNEYEKIKKENQAKRDKELQTEATEKRDKFLNSEGPKIFKEIVEDNKGNGKKQRDAYLKIGKEKINDKDTNKDYTKKEIFDGWLSHIDKDSNTYKNWNDNHKKIKPLLKLYLDKVLPNVEDDIKGESYLKYANLLVDCLLPCKFEGKKMLIESDDKTDDSGVKVKIDDSKRVCITSSDPEGVKEFKMKYIIENQKCGFTVYNLENADERRERLKEIILSKEHGEFVYGKVSHSKKELLIEALDLISKNIIKIEKDIIKEVLCNLHIKYKEHNVTPYYILSDKVFNRVKEELEKLEKMKKDDYTDKPTNNPENLLKSE